jgi:hypothetical protein
MKRLGHWAVRRSCLGLDPGCVRRVGDGDRLRVLVLGVMLLRMDLFVFLQILRTFETFLANIAVVGLEWRMN